MNIGEQLVADYLQFIKGCQFTQQCVQIIDEQGEIDVIGIDTKKKIIYVCEVAIHLITGLRYTKDGQGNNIPKIIEKFERDNRYITANWKDYKPEYMLWSPIVKTPKKRGSYNQIEDVERIVSELKKQKINVTPIINILFWECIKELKDYAFGTKRTMESPVMRYLQIETRLKTHLNI